MINLSKVEVKERLKYIWDRIQYRLGKGNYYLGLIVADLGENGALTPESLKIVDSNLQAAKDYIGKVYPGKITLFRSQIQSVERAQYSDLGWGDLVGASLEIHHIPGDHGVFREPYIQGLAEKLNFCLNSI